MNEEANSFFAVILFADTKEKRVASYTEFDSCVKGVFETG